MPRLMPAKPTIFSFFSKASLGVRGVVWMLVSFVNLLLSGFSEMRSFFSIRRSAVKGNFSIDAMKSSGVIKMMLLTFFALAAMQGELLAQIAQRGTATFAESTSTSVSINKPSGLAVGDLMIATINQSTNNGGVSLSDAALTGWIKPNSGAGGRYYENGDDEWWGVVLYKFADASDVAASNFTFQGDVDADDIQGSIIAFSGVDESTPFDAIGSFTTSATLNTTIIANSIATTVPNTAIVMLAFISDNQSFSGWTSTSPSSLTELFDRAFNATVDMGIGGAWATKTNTGQTGNGTVTIANNVADGAILLALKPKINTATTLASSANPIVYGATPTLTATVTPNSASGTVEFFDGSTSLGIATLTGTTTKTATLTLTAGQVDAGTRSITARYLESTTHNVSTSSALSLTVNQRPIQISGSREYYGTITINSSVLSIANLLSGDNVTIAGTGILSAANAGSRTVTQGALPARVRSATGSTGSNAATSFSVTLPVAPSNGNTLIAVISTRGNSDGRVTGITQTGATWTRAVQRTNVNGTTIEIWYTTALSSAGSGITISQANLRSAAVVIEYSGLLLPESIDVSAGNSGSGTTASTGTTGTTSQANTVLIGGIGFASSSPSLSSISGSFSQVATAASTNGTAGNNAEVFALERIVTSTGTFFSGGIISATTQWSGAIAAFRATIPSGNPLSLSGADAGNYTFSGSTGSVTITPKALTIGPPSITTPSKEYDGTRSTGPVTVGTLSGFVGSETVTATAAGEYADANVGTNKTATITYTLEDGTNGGLASNYSLANGTAIGSITSKSLTITGAITADKVYDGTNTAIVTGGTLVGVVGSDVVSLTQSGTFAQIGVGNNIAITSTSTLGGANAGNYTLIQPSLAARDITPKTITVTGLTGANKVYDGTTAATATGTASLVGVISPDAVSLTGTPIYTFGTANVGTGISIKTTGYTLTGAKAGNYTLTQPTLSANITAATLTVTGLTGANKVYDGTTAATATGTASLVGVISPDAVSLTGTPIYTFGTANVGTGISITTTGYSLTGANAGNYTLTQPSLSGNITPLPITITADAKSKVYGNADPGLTYQITTGSLASGDSFSGSLNREVGENVGSYAIIQGSLALNSNYALTYVGANLTITTRTITVTADAKTKVYGNSDPALTYQISSGNLVFSDSFSGSLSREVGEYVGIYGITQGSLALNNNYVLTYVGADFTITTRAITITADAKSKVYGNADPGLTYQITTGSLASGDSFSGSLSRATGESVGTYLITQGTLALNSNYALTYVGANLTITSRAITITADAKTKVYGNADPALTYQITTGSLASGDSFSGSLSRAIGENVGTYAITQGTLALNNNYALTYVGANLTITPRAITVTADSMTKIYGSDDPTFTYQITSGSLLGTDVLSGSLARAAGEDVGTYSIAIGTLGNSNYTITLVSADFSITPKTLVITPNAGQSKLQAAEDPILTYHASGWEFSDNTNLLTGALSRVAGEPVGTYAITLGTLAVSGSNYVISFTTGITFAILERPAVKLAFVASPSGTSTVAGQPFATQPVVQIQNDLGGVVASATTSVTLSLLEGSGELRGTVTLNAVNGVATFTGLNIDLVGIDKVLLAEAAGLESATTGTFTITPAAAALFTKYAGDQQVTQVGTAVDIAPAVSLQDIFGNPIVGVSVSFAVTSGGGSILPTSAIVTDLDGIAALTSWTLGASQGQNTLTASTSGFSSLTFTALGSEDLKATITSSGTWTVPAGVTEIIVEGWGAGGAGGSVSGANNRIRAAAGGGGGAYAKKKLQVTPGQVLSLIIGQGGSASGVLNGSAGGDTYITGFSTQFLAKGGSGGGGHNGSVPGIAAGGSASLSRGDQIIAGGNGGAGSNTGNSGAGGNGANGGGLGGASVSSSLANGNNGQMPGGGGSGARVEDSNNTVRTGGSGGSGKIVITYPKPVNQFRASTSGNWEDAATWEQQFSNGQFAKINTKPEANATVIISRPGVSVQGAPATVTVTVSQDLNFTGSITVTSEGELALASGKNLTLASGSSLNIGNEGILSLPSNGVIIGAGNVAINKGATLAIANPEGVKGTGTAGGAIQNTGTRTFSSEANYRFIGTAAQVIGNGLPATVNGLVIDNPTKVTLDRPLEVTLDLEVHSGILELEETLTVDLGMELKGSSRLLIKQGKKFQADLLADLTTGGSSRIVIEPGAKYLNLGISTPRLEVQQRLTGEKGWRMLGAPVSGESYGGFLNKLETQGYTGAKNPTLQPNVLWWDEQEAGTTVQGWRKPTNSSDLVPAGRGHYVFVFNGEAKKVANTGNYADALPITLAAIGNEVNLNNGGVDFGVTFTKRTNKFKGNSTDKDYSEAGSADEGFNLIANPTASFIDFFAPGWTKDNIDNTIYVWDQNYNQVVEDDEDDDEEDEVIQGAFRLITSETPSSQRIIAPYQGFWVRTNSASPRLVMTNDVKADEFSAFYGRVLEEKPVIPASRIRLDVAGEGLMAESVIRVSEEGQDGLDPWDAFQLESLDNNWLNLYTLGSPKELTPLAINHLSLPTEGEKTIPLYLAAAKNGKPFSGTYTLNWDLPADLSAGTKLVLMDHISKKAIDMSEVKTYTFSFEAPVSTNARIRDEEGEMKVPQAVVFSHEIKDGEGDNFRTATGKVTRPFSIIIGYKGGEELEYRPETAKVFAPSPNPFVDMTQVKFYLPVTEEVEVKIYDMKGQEVGGFARKSYPAGINVLEWRPTAVHLPKGVYLIQVQTETMVMTQKAIKL